MSLADKPVPQRLASVIAFAVGIALLVFPTPAAAAPPPNDDFAAAQAVAGEAVSVLGSNVEATGEAGEPDHALSSQPLASVWYSWVAPADGPVVIDTCATDSDTTLAVYTGDALDALEEIASSDDGFTCTSLGSMVRFVAVEGQTYRIAVDGFEAAEGEFILSVEPGATPANDAFASAEPLTGMEAFAQGHNVGATGEAGEPDHADASVPLHSVWYRWRAPAAGPVFVDTCFANFDTTLAVYRGTSVSGLTEVASNNDSDEFCGAVTSAVEFTAASGETYWIAVDGFEAESGDFALELFQSPPPPPPRPPSPGGTTPPPPPPAGTVAPAPTSGGPTGADTTPPSIRILGRRLRMTRSGKVRLRLRCRDAVSATCAGVVRVRTAKRIRNRGARRFVRLARKSFEINTGRTAVVRIDLGPRARRVVTRLAKLRIRISVTGRDAAGNVRITTRTLRLTAARR